MGLLRTESLKTKVVELTLYLLAFLFLIPQICWAGAWTQEKGDSYHYLSFAHYETNSQFSETGELVPYSNQGKFNKRELNYYLEYGLDDDITLIGNFFYDWIGYRDESWKRTNQGLSSIELGLRFKLLEKDSVLSLHSLVSIPPRAEEDPFLPITNGQLALELRLLLGRYLPHSKAYTNFELAFRRYCRDGIEELRYQILCGWKKWWPCEFALQYDGIINLRNTQPTRTLQHVTIAAEDFDLHRLTGTVIYHLKENRSLTLQYYHHIAGRNTGQGWGITGGVIFEHRR